MKRLLTIAVSASLCLCGRAGTEQYKAEAVKEYVHDTGAYTQGLFFHDGILYESTGQFGESSLRTVDLSSGKVLRKLDFARKYFCEGSVVLDGKIFLLTWLNKVAFVYDAVTLKYEKTCSYPREGWGLTTDGKELIASDGSSRLYFMDKEFRVTRTLPVRIEGRPALHLNELEWIDGKIWANVYTSNLIYIINPENGDVESVVDCSDLLPDRLRTSSTDVLNGIAVSGDGKIYVTGKYWPRIYEIKLK